MNRPRQRPTSIHTALAAALAAALATAVAAALLVACAIPQTTPAPSASPPALGTTAALPASTALPSTPTPAALPPTPTALVPVPAPTPAIDAILNAAAQVCTGGGTVAAAAAYDVLIPLRPLLLLSASGGPHDWSAQLPAEWLPPALDALQLVACLGDEQQTISTCSYTGPRTVEKVDYALPIRVLEVRTGYPVAAITLQGGGGPYDCPQAVPAGAERLDGPQVTVEQVHAWLASLVESEIAVWRTLVGHTDTVNAVAWSPTGDGEWLASGGRDGTVRLWRVAEGQEVAAIEVPGEYPKNSVDALAWSPDGTRFATGSDFLDKLFIWDAETAEALEIWHTSRPRALAWSPPLSATPMLAVGSTGGVTILDAASGEQLSHWPTASTVGSIAWAPDGAAIAYGLLDGSVIVHDAVTGEKLHSLAKHTKRVSYVAWSPDSTLLASAGLDRLVIAWHAGRGEPQHVIVPDVPVLSIAWSPDGKRIAAGGVDGSVRLWDMESGIPIQALGKLDGSVESLAWSPALQTMLLSAMPGSMLAAGGSGGALSIWRVP